LNEVFGRNLIDVQDYSYLLNYDLRMRRILKMRMKWMKHDDVYDYFDEDFDRMGDYLKLIKKELFVF
jgi:uncharacterized membrane protein YpjA